MLSRRFMGLILFAACVAAPLQPIRGTMAETTSIPRPEYPRPDFRRDNWLNLNGAWGFRIDPDNAGEAGAWYAPESPEIRGQIVVPFPWQSKLSGVENLLHRGVAWYRRAIQVPAAWAGQRTVLHFGAVDYFAKVWVNGKLMGEHEGGYTPF